MRLSHYLIPRIVGPLTLFVDDYVFVNPVNNSEGGVAYFVAKVLEIRADGPTCVYVRVYWMYWPEELPMSRQSYHGASELVASNDMVIIDAMTIADRAVVSRIAETEDNAPPMEGLYWRQNYDILEHTLSVRLLFVHKKNILLTILRLPSL